MMNFYLTPNRRETRLAFFFPLFVHILKRHAKSIVLYMLSRIDQWRSKTMFKSSVCDIFKQFIDKSSVADDA